jgi:hypothetical protein
VISSIFLEVEISSFDVAKRIYGDRKVYVRTLSKFQRMSSVLASSRFGGGGGVAAGQPADLESQIMNTVRQDMEAVDKLGQWVFSCYSPAKDCVSVPGMADFCPEELRYGRPLSLSPSCQAGGLPGKGCRHGGAVHCTG